MKATKYLLLALAGLSAQAQNVMTSSPYSMFGIGEIMPGLNGVNAGMGGVAYGIRDSWFLNISNPAGLVGLDSCKLYAETSAFIKREDYRSNDGSYDAVTGNLSAFLLGGRIRRGWYMAAGVSPYSSVGYYFQTTQPLEGTPSSTVTSTFTGEGGLSKVFLSNAVLLPGGISAGVNLNYVFGNMTQKEVQESVSEEQNIHAQAFHADFGLQYRRPTGKHTVLTLGAVYGYRQKLSLESTTTVTTSTSQTSTSERSASQYLPQFFGLGGSVVHKKWTYALDYSFRQYSAIRSGDNRIVFRDTHELRSGVAWFPDGYSSEAYWKHIRYMGGLSASTPDMRINGKDGLSLRASLGASLPIANGRITASFFYDWTKLEGTVFQKNILGFTLTYTLSERLYQVKL